MYVVHLMAQEEVMLLGQGIPCYFLDHSFTLSSFITPAFRGIRSSKLEKKRQQKTVNVL